VPCPAVVGLRGWITRSLQVFEDLPLRQNLMEGWAIKSIQASLVMVQGDLSEKGSHEQEERSLLVAGLQ
jgi:hypothetical protein